MRGRLHRWVWRWWSGGLGAGGFALSALTAPLEWLYAYEVARRSRAAHRAGGERIPGLPVVSVGNLAVGGTGKTPFSAWVARRLVEADAHVALLSRGYGRDEILLHERWNPAVPVVSNPDRVAGALAAQARGAGVVVLDDGFQHRRLARDVDLVLFAAEDRLDGRMLPRGPFREPVSALGRADAVIVTRRTASREQASTLAERIRGAVPGRTVACVALLPGTWQDLHGAPAPPPEGPTLAVAAVARPEAFAAQVAAATGEACGLLAFPDHHVFTPDDVRAMRAEAGGRTVVVTEKDAVKLPRFAGALGPVRALTQRLAWESGEGVVTGLITSVLAEKQ